MSVLENSWFQGLTGHFLVYTMGISNTGIAFTHPRERIEMLINDQMNDTAKSIAHSHWKAGKNVSLEMLFTLADSGYVFYSGGSPITQESLEPQIDQWIKDWTMEDKETQGFNGYESYEHWNISLWLNDDEGLYSLGQDLVKIGLRRDWDAFDIALELEDALNEMGMTCTPDDVPFKSSLLLPTVEEWVNEMGEVTAR